ncbi:RAI14 [Symbiodinium natans]|uniref:RAI14 protein n=1 Tax=Symbiodinium natans TaxID=878477 RepID=A0A812R0V3_9DINO|nr:RAI14 [Symbiodinium natans]
MSEERVEMEFDIPPEEQIILFQGKFIAQRYMTQKENAMQPLNTPDLQEIVEEAGEDGLQMTVVHKPFRLGKFMKKEGAEEDDLDVKLKPGGCSLLQRAVRRCEISVVEELLVKEEFTRCNARDRAGQTALHTACTARQRECATILLKSKCFQAVYKKDLEGRNALHYIACWGDEPTARLLLAHERFRRRHIQAEDIFGYTPMSLAADCGHTKIVEAIREALTAKEGDDDEEEPDEDPSRPASPEAASAPPEGELGEAEAGKDEVAADKAPP